MGKQANALGTQRRDQQLLSLRDEGVPVEELAELFGLSTSTVGQCLERERARLRAGVEPPDHQVLVIVDRDEQGRLRERHVRLAIDADVLAVAKARLGGFTRKPGQELNSAATVVHADSIFAHFDDESLCTEERIHRLHMAGANAETLKRILHVSHDTVAAVATARGWRSEAKDDEAA
jgi:hypothetical protein